MSTHARSSPRNTMMSLDPAAAAATSKAPAGRPAQPGGRRGQGLVPKHATLVSANVRGYLLAAHGGPPAALLELHAGLLAELLARVSVHKGLTDGMSADRFHASVNGARAAVRHCAAGGRLATDLAGGAGGGLRLAPLLPDALRRHRGLSVAAGACSGSLLCGDMGCEGLRRYSFVGHAAAWVHACDRLATRWGATAAVNSPVQQDTACIYYFRLRASAVMDKPSHAESKPQTVWEVLQQRSGAEDTEWMYLLQEQEDADPLTHYNRALAAVYRGDFDEALGYVSEGRAGVAQGGGGAAGAVMETTEILALLEEVDCDARRRPPHAHLLLEEARAYRPGDTAPAAAAAPGTVAATMAALIDDAALREAEEQRTRGAERGQQQQQLNERVAQRRKQRDRSTP